MFADIIIVVLFVLLLLYGLRKGIVLGVVDFVFVVVYINVANPLLETILRMINNQGISDHINGSPFSHYLTLSIIGMIILALINKIIAKALKVTHLSFFDKLLGVVVYGLIAFVLVCIANIVVTSTQGFLDANWSSVSFFLSDRFFEYNLIRTWFGAR